ncbi:MAG: hypothetical protein DRH51_06080 [Candidatus Coatesbacteria bacterium]|nr:MAG: hypothetical protein DRH51_06080 [Candidatus Coatesbacteria bacterium]
MMWGLIYNLKVTTSGSSGMIFLLKFQVASYSNLDKIDVGVCIVTTSNFQKNTKRKYNHNWQGSLTYEKLTNYLPHFKSAIQLPVYVYGVDIHQG